MMYRLSLLLIVLLICPRVLAQSPEKDVYGPVVSGFFYPRDEQNLKKMINTLMDKVPRVEPPGKPLALISPHAGYDYSGAVAAYGYSTLKGRDYKRVIILAPSHYGKRYRGASLLKADYYQTPLGIVEIDKESCKKLMEKSPRFDNQPLFGNYSAAYKNEHSMETQLPFLQTVLGEFKLVPVLLGVLVEDDFEKIATALRDCMDENTLVVASSDFTHYGSRFGYVPFQTQVEENIKRLDYGAIDRILVRDFDGLIRYREETGITVCGITPIAVLLKLLPEEAQGKVLNYDTSGRLTKDFTNSVSYTSIIFTSGKEKKTGNPPKADQPQAWVIKTGGVIEESNHLTKEEASVLLNIARKTLEGYARTKKLPEVEENKLSPRLKEKSGVFVTLNKGEELRGCIGHILPKETLWKAVMENTVNSAFGDIRFSPVREEEVDNIEIEISVLSPLRRIKGPEEFQVGKEGIMIKLGRASAVFLPQVAGEQGWDKHETLCHLCRKAGLPWNAWWDKDMEFYVFTAMVFHEGVLLGHTSP